jgi:hypothetical protein
MLSELTKIVALFGLVSFLVGMPLLAASDTPANTSSGHAADASVKHVSSENRQGKNVSIIAEITATYIPISAPGVGARTVWFISDQNLLEIGYSRSSAVEFYGLSTMNFYMNYFSLQAKHFFGNSFFVGAGIATKKIIAKESGFFSSGSLVSNFEIEQQVTTRGLEFGLGNRWQWRHFTLGGDWLGIYAPSSSSIKHLDLDPRVSEEQRRLFGERVRIRTISRPELFVRFGLGASF